MLTSAGGVELAFSRFCSAMSPPKVVLDVHDAIRMVALGADVLANSASMIASSSLVVTPGSVQLLLPLGGAVWLTVSYPSVYAPRPNIERNEVQSAVL